MNLLILEHSADVFKWAEEFKKALTLKFPELSVHTAREEEEAAGDFIEKADIFLTTRASDELIKKARKLQWIQVLLSGVDYIVNNPSLKKQVLVTSMRGIAGPQTSEMAFLLMLALSRNFQQIIRNQDQGIWERWPAKLLYKKKIGILGVGVIGQEIARKCKAFGMTVIGIGNVNRVVDSLDHFYWSEDLFRVLPEIDYFIIIAPLTPKTRKMIGAEAFSSMKCTAFLINIGRGKIIDEEALIHALNSGQIAGAALDTFWSEPLPKDHPFWGMNNVIITPHVGGISDIYAEQALPIVEENLRRFLRGERRNLVNVVERNTGS